MGAAVYAIDHGIGRGFEFVVETTIDQPAYDRRIEAFGCEHIACRSALDAAFGEGAVHAFDDVAAFSEFSQGGLGLVADHPLAGAELVGETEGFQLVQAPDLLGVIFVRLHLWIGRHVDDACMATITDELAVELGPALRPDLPL